MVPKAKNLYMPSRVIGIFRDRQEAGSLLGKELKRLSIKGDVVLGIPRGGLVVAEKIAEKLKIPLDLVLSCKLTAPRHPEFAIGSVSENGKEFINQGALAGTKTSETYILQEKKRQTALLKKRKEQYREVRPKLPLQGKTVIIADDGVATGATLQAALWAAEQEKPAALIAAIPVGAPENVEMLAKTADKVVCLLAPFSFYAIGQFYKIFSQVEDDEVLDILRRQNHGKV